MSENPVRKSDSEVSVEGAAEFALSAVQQLKDALSEVVAGMTPDDVTLDLSTDHKGVTTFKFRSYRRPPVDDRRR